MEGEAVSTFLVGRLRDLLVKEGAFLLALTDSVDKLVKILSRMEELLEYAHVRRDKGTFEIIELADHMIDSIEKYVFRVVNEYTGFREYFMRPKVSLCIEKITTKVVDFVNSQGEVSSFDTSGLSRDYKVQDLSSFNLKDFVGREEDVNNLVSYLVDHEDERYRVISIYGMGGLGKTTLVRQVYREKKILNHFQGFAFVCVSEQCQTEDILKHILQQLLHQSDQVNMSATDVIESLQRMQREKRCLIVIDDIWSVPDWESLKRGLSDGSTGSKVVLTTRIKDVADKGFCYSLECLSDEECWELLQKKTFRCQGPEAEAMRQELGKKMIAWCRGIPLAVLVLRGVLVTKGSVREWQRFYDSKNWGGEAYEQFNSEVGEELLFSYKELPYQLKPCFLYLATYAEDEKIDVETLYMLWDAEGMILSKDREVGETMMDVAERYLSELVGRSMIEAELAHQVHPNVRRRYKFCQLHDLMRTLCLSIVKKENFLEVSDYRLIRNKVIGLNSSCPRNAAKVPTRQVLYFSRWNQDLSVHYGKSEGIRYVRSLMIKCVFEGKLSMLKKLNLLRVLSYNEVGINGKETFCYQHIHLRYLSVNNCSIRKFPSSIYNMMYLQILDMRAFNHPQHGLTIPNLAMRKLKRLRHLFLPFLYIITPNLSKLRLDTLTELETLVNFHSSMCEMKDVTELTNLKRLVWTSMISSEDDCNELKKFMKKVNLDPSWNSSLEIELVNPKVEMHSDVLNGKLPKFCEDILHKLQIHGMRGNFSPEFSNFSQLTELYLFEFEVEKDPLPTLEKLSNLQYLVLRKGKLKGNAMICSKGGFPQLRKLFFSSLENWEKWGVEDGAMSNLQKLWIWDCQKLEMLPDELKLITSFVYIRTEEMPQDFTRRFIHGVEYGQAGGVKVDYHKLKGVQNGKWVELERGMKRVYSDKWVILQRVIIGNEFKWKMTSSM